MDKIVVLGAGVTGLAAGMTCGASVFEQTPSPGGICSSYYIYPGKSERMMQAPEDEGAYRFEIGGGHWIFGGDPAIAHFIRRLTAIKTYIRRSSVYFCRKNLYVPYPLQNHLRFLGQDIAQNALQEMVQAPRPNIPANMKEWLEQNFGSTLCELFFFPFHELYTGRLYHKIAPQDAYKSPVDIGLAIQGAFSQAPAVGYNATFVYPQKGLNTLAQQMATTLDVHYNKRVVEIDVHDKRISFADGSQVYYDTLISTLSLNKMLQITKLLPDIEVPPNNSVLVVNIGAVRGRCFSDDQWLYVPDSHSGFHRVGCYSNVDVSFLPKCSRQEQNRLSLYIEKTYCAPKKPTDEQIKKYCKDVVAELQQWKFIEDVEVVDPTWIDVAYTWQWPNSNWKQQALSVLEQHSIYQVGRYARWNFQGIADSIRDGLFVGAAMKNIR